MAIMACSLYPRAGSVVSRREQEALLATMKKNARCVTHSASSLVANIKDDE